MIRQSKTTIKELSAQYRSVLKRAFLAGLVAMATSGAYAAGADVTFAGNYVNASDATVNVNDPVADEPYSYEKSNGDFRNVASQDTDPTLTDFTYTDKNGDPATLASGTQTQTDFTGTTAASGVVTTTQEIVAGATVLRDNYEYVNGKGNTVTLGTSAQDMVENVALNTDYTPDTVIGVINGTADSFDGTLYSTTVGSETYHLSADGTKLVDSHNIEVTPTDPSPEKDAFDAMQAAYNSDVLLINGAETSTAAEWVDEQANFATANTAFTTDEGTVTTLNTRWESYETAAGLLTAAQNAQGDAQTIYGANTTSAADALAVYDAPITSSITNGANAAIAASITNENGAIKTALNTAETNAKDYADGLASNYDAAGAADTAEQNAKDYADGLAANYDAAGAASTAKGEAINSANGYTDGKIATEVENRNAAIATAKGEAIESANAYTDNTALAIRNDFASGDTLTLAKANAYTDERVNELEKDMSSGIASATALSAVSVPNVKKGQLAVSGGYGYYNSQSAFALGAAVGLTSKWSANVGAALSDRNATFRAGTSYLIDLF